MLHTTALHQCPYREEIKQVFTPAEFRRGLDGVAGARVVGVHSGRGGALRFTLRGEDCPSRRWVLTVDGRWEFHRNGRAIGPRDGLRRMRHTVRVVRAFEVARCGSRIRIVFNGGYGLTVAANAHGLLRVEDAHTQEWLVASAHPDFRFYRAARTVGGAAHGPALWRCGIMRPVKSTRNTKHQRRHETGSDCSR